MRRKGQRFSDATPGLRFIDGGEDSDGGVGPWLIRAKRPTPARWAF
jgi:hypothetical protein